MIKWIMTQQIGDVALPTIAQTLTGAIAENHNQIATLENNQAYRAGDVITIPCNYRLFTARCGWSGNNAQMQIVLDKPVIGTIKQCPTARRNLISPLQQMADFRRK